MQIVKQEIVLPLTGIIFLASLIIVLTEHFAQIDFGVIGVIAWIVIIFGVLYFILWVITQVI
ncbi:MAG: hypothetical protein WBC40_07495 [Halobacteriota archaeon]